MIVTQQPLPFPDLTLPALRWRIGKQKRTTKCVARAISLGAGLQSSVLAEMAILGEIDADLIIFADTGCEPPWVYEQVWYLADKAAAVGLPFLIVSRLGDGLLGDSQNPALKRFAKMPLYTVEDGRRGILRRQCTREYKIEPVSQGLRRWLFSKGYATKDKNGVFRAKRNIHVNMMLGITWDEIERANSSGFPNWQNPVYPFIEQRMTRQDCVRWLTARNLHVPNKSSCIVCPFHNNNFWMHLRDDAPEDFETACQFDDWLRTDSAQYYLRALRADVYLHHSYKPLREVDFDDPELPLFSEAVCGGLCDV